MKSETENSNDLSIDSNDSVSPNPEFSNMNIL